jgi:thiol-disulfide isomerase/thioredoxin
MKHSALVLLAVLLFGCSDRKNQQQEADKSSVTSNYKENVSLIVNVEKKEGSQAPNFSWTDETGKRVSFSEISKGKPVLVNFWATWCGPCIAETPDLVAIYDEYRSKGALVIGISTDRDDDALNLVSNFTKEKKVTYPIIIDNGELEEAFGGLRGYPTTFYIDKNGMIVKKFIGLQSKEKFAAEFNALL